MYYAVAFCREKIPPLQYILTNILVLHMYNDVKGRRKGLDTPLYGGKNGD